MKILAIRGKNLASLAGDFEVDFTVEPLKNAGIFAITGSTGSGKSTLLDALCLALFDSTPRMTKARESKVELADVRNKTIAQSDSRSVLRRGTAEGYAEVDFIALTGETYRSTWTACRAGGKPSGILRSVGFRLMKSRARGRNFLLRYPSSSVCLSNNSIGLFCWRRVTLLFF